MTRKYLDMDPQFLRLLAVAILKDVRRALSTSGFQRVKGALVSGCTVRPDVVEDSKDH